MTLDVAVLVELFLGEECFGGKADLLLFLDVADNEDRVGVVASDDLIQLDVVALDLGA